MIREANKNDLDEILQLYYKRATMEDIDELVRTRIIVLRAADKLSDDEDMSVVEEKSYAFIGVRWKAVSILHIWCMITESLSELVVSAFIRLCRPIIIRQVKRRIL